MSMVRIGIYGAGQMGTVHARTLAGFAGVSVVGVADADETRARATAAAAGAEPCPDLDTLLAMRPDAVFVGVPNIHHAQASITALERGVDVFCEKPMATTLEDAQRVLHTVEHTGRAYQIGFNRRFAPAYAGMRALVAGGMTVYSGTLKINDGDRRTPVWLSDAAISGGFIYDKGIHLLDMARWILGPIDEVRCLARSSCYPDMDDAVALLRSRGGAIVTFSACGHATWTAPTERVELFGNHATAVTEGFERLVHAPGLGRSTAMHDFRALPYEQRLGYEQEEQAFLEAIVSGRPTPVSAEDGYRACELVDACYRSAAADGTPVRLA